MTKKPAKKSLLAQLVATCAKANAALDRSLERVVAMLDAAGQEAYDKDMVSHLAWLTKNLAQIGGEIRKMEAAEAKSADLDGARVLEWARRRTPAERAQLIAELTEMDRRKSVL